MNLADTIIAKSDQLNADDLIGRSITIKITNVTGKSGEQPIAIHFEGDEGKPYLPCKSMRRVLVFIWGADGKAYVGRRLTLFRDPAVKFGGIEVGGIRISHMSDIKEPISLALTASKGSKKAFVVKPLPPEHAAPSLHDMLYDIETAPTLDGLRFKHAAAYKAFTDEASRLKIDAVKDTRKEALVEAAGGGQAA